MVKTKKNCGSTDPTGATIYTNIYEMYDPTKKWFVPQRVAMFEVVWSPYNCFFIILLQIKIFY